MDFDGKRVFCLDGSGEISLKDIGNRVMSGNGFALEVTEVQHPAHLPAALHGGHGRGGG